MVEPFSRREEGVVDGGEVAAPEKLRVRRIIVGEGAELRGLGAAAAVLIVAEMNDVCRRSTAGFWSALIINGTASLRETKDEPVSESSSESTYELSS